MPPVAAPTCLFATLPSVYHCCCALSPSPRSPGDVALLTPCLSLLPLWLQDWPTAVALLLEGCGLLAREELRQVGRGGGPAARMLHCGCRIGGGAALPSKADASLGRPRTCTGFQSIAMACALRRCCQVGALRKLRNEAVPALAAAMRAGILVDAAARVFSATPTQGAPGGWQGSADGGGERSGGSAHGHAGGSGSGGAFGRPPALPSLRTGSSSLASGVQRPASALPRFVQEALGEGGGSFSRAGRGGGGGCSSLKQLVGCLAALDGLEEGKAWLGLSARAQVGCV